MRLRGVVVAIALTAFVRAPAPRAANALQLVVCGWDEVFIVALDNGLESKPRPLWTWKALGRGDLPEDIQPLFRHTDECKPYDGGSSILVTSSDGAAALVDRANDKVLFYARAANAHSADRLPGGRIAVAASHDKAGKGDRLIVFDQQQSDRELWSEALPWGHGVVWDAQRRLLWALADADVRVFELQDWESSAPKLRRVALIPLPENGGHDFSPIAGTALIAVSTSNHVWLFNRDSRRLEPHRELGDKAKVKSVSHHPGTGRIAYVQAEGSTWWAERIYFLKPSGTLHVAGEHFYKARWNVQPE